MLRSIVRYKFLNLSLPFLCKFRSCVPGAEVWAGTQCARGSGSTAWSCWLPVAIEEQEVTLQGFSPPLA